MTEAVPLVALVGNPNAGKSALFNALTGARQKIANYPGVTVERKSGRLALADGRPVELLDLPGAYSLEPDSLDEAVTRDVVLGRLEGQRRPDALVVVLDAGNLDNHLRFAIELIGQGLPVVIALIINVPFAFGGTSLLIVVGVALDTMAQMQQHLLLRKYDGFMKKGRVRFRGRQAMGGGF